MPLCHPPCNDAHTTFIPSLPQDLAAALKGASLDKALAPALSASLAKPLQDALRGAFAKQLVPAFEGATQAAFQQINAAFSAGFEEHLQASGLRGSPGMGRLVGWSGLSVATCVTVCYEAGMLLKGVKTTRARRRRAWQCAVRAPATTDASL
jgi:hypothetical protein